LADQLNPALADPVGAAVRSYFPTAFLSSTANAATQSWYPTMYSAACTFALQVFSRRQLFEVVVDVLSNHLNVQGISEKTIHAAPDYYQNVIRANAFGRFSDMLTAAMRHPALLRFLDNDKSSKASVNENLGRELLELHTLGVGSGYTETDVRNSAYILSGRGLSPANEWVFAYTAANHWTGAVTVMGFSDANTDAAAGLAMGDRYLSYLAHHASTARTLATKLATRFVSDSPPSSLIDRMAAAYLANDTQIVPMLTALFSSTEFWASGDAKTRRPLEDVTGCLRAIDPVPTTGLADNALGFVFSLLGDMSHTTWDWAPPNGYPDVAGAWVSASTLVRRWNFHWTTTRGQEPVLRPNPQFATQCAPVKGETYAAWLDRLSDRLHARPMGDVTKAAILGYLNVSATAPAVSTATTTLEVVCLMLASIDFHLR
jgi:uncharacterized protein (DUF1800 family)